MWSTLNEWRNDCVSQSEPMSDSNSVLSASQGHRWLQHQTKPRSPSERRGSGLHCSGEGGQRGFLEERLLKSGFEDRSSAEKGIQEVGRNEGHVPGPMMCSVWPEHKECINQAAAADKRRQSEELGLASFLNQKWSLPVLQLLHQHRFPLLS